MKICYKINNGIVYEIPKYWSVKIFNDILIILINDYIILSAVLVDNNLYIGYYSNVYIYFIILCKHNIKYISWE